MVGYWRNPEMTRERMRDGWISTRDMGRFDENGYLYIVDRKDDMVITGGFNVWPAEVEGVLYEHPAVREVAVFGVPDEKWGEAVIAAVGLKSKASVAEGELRDFVGDRLARYKIPKKVWLIDHEIPKSAADKPLRRRAAEQYLAEQGQA
jgi:acyl-CoA synthetase (AMP-forming)/AMP-acid ligase II